jgi:hypothetical protein
VSRPAAAELWRYSLKENFMASIHFVLAVLTLASLGACGGGSDHAESAAICLATLAHKNAWSDAPSGGQSAFGTYSGMTDSHIHKFKSGNGRYVFACEVQGSRVHTAQAPTELGGNPQINYSRNDEIYTFRVDSNSINLEISYGSGQPGRATFSLPGIKGRL